MAVLFLIFQSYNPITFIPFSCLTELPKTYNTMPNRSGDTRHTSIFPGYKTKE